MQNTRTVHLLIAKSRYTGSYKNVVHYVQGNLLIIRANHIILFIQYLHVKIGDRINWCQVNTIVLILRMGQRLITGLEF